MELMGLVTEYIALQLTWHCWSFSLWNVIRFGDLYVYFGWTVEIKTTVDVSWGIFTMWCVAHVYFYCFVCSVGDRSWEVLCSWWQTVSRTEQLHSVHRWCWQYFVVWPWYLTFYYYRCRWKCWCECLHLTNARIILGKVWEVLSCIRSLLTVLL